MNNGLLQAALEYAALGYAVFPCAPGGKQPIKGSNGCKDATTDEDQICKWWEAEPNANIGLSTAGLVVVDIDGDKNEWLQDKKVRSSLADGAASKTPRGGRHYLFRQVDGVEFRNTASKIAPNVDTRADGGYILAPPSVVNGKPYQWLETYELEESIDDLAEVPGWIVELLEKDKHKPFELPEDGIINNGIRHDTLFRYGCKMRRWGASRNEIEAALVVMNRDRCEGQLSSHEVEKIAESAAKYQPDQRNQAEIEVSLDGLLQKDKKSVDPGPFPPELLHVPGYLEMVMNYMTDTAYKPQPVLNLAASISLMGTLTGRRITDPYGTRTNVYCLGVCRSGGGKDNARKVNKAILEAGDALDMMGPEGIASHAGLFNAVEHRPCQLFQIDEMGRILKTLSNPNSSPHLYNIITVLMRMFSTADSTYVGDAYADLERNKVIKEPHVCVYGTTVPQSLYEGFTAESISDGFLSRMLIFESDNHDPRQKDPEIYAVPSEIADITNYWHEFVPTGLMNSQHAGPHVVKYDHSAVTVFQDLEDIAYNERQRCCDSEASLWTRTTEKARKLALIYACSESHKEPTVTTEAAEWACRLSEYLTRKLLHIASDWISDNPFDAKKKQVLRILKNAGSDGMSLTQICRRTRSMRSKERRDVLDSLCECGEAIADDVGEGRALKTVYKAV